MTASAAEHNLPVQAVEDLGKAPVEALQDSPARGLQICRAARKSSNKWKNLMVQWKVLEIGHGRAELCRKSLRVLYIHTYIYICIYIYV